MQKELPYGSSFSKSSAPTGVPYVNLSYLLEGEFKA